MNQVAEVQEQTVSFEADEPALEVFSQTAISTSENTPRLIATGFATCPASSGQYC